MSFENSNNSEQFHSQNEPFSSRFQHSFHMRKDQPLLLNSQHFLPSPQEKEKNDELLSILQKTIKTIEQGLLKTNEVVASLDEKAIRALISPLVEQISLVIQVR
jgi:hypothetical protein